MKRLFNSFAVFLFTLTSLFLISCATTPQGCVTYTEFETCRDGYTGPIECQNPKRIIDRDKWENDERAGRLSLSAGDVIEIRKKLKLLEILTCE